MAQNARLSLQLWVSRCPAILPTNQRKPHCVISSTRMRISSALRKKQPKSTTKSTNKVKNNLKQIIFHCCYYLMHTFEVSRFEVLHLISRLFWAVFQNLQICMWWGVGRSDFGPTFFVKVQLSIEWCAFCMLEKVEPDTCTWCSFCLSLDFHVTPAGWWHFERDVNTFGAEKCRVFTPEKPLFPRIK